MGSFCASAIFSAPVSIEHCFLLVCLFASQEFPKLASYLRPVSTFQPKPPPLPRAAQSGLPSVSESQASVRPPVAVVVGQVCQVVGRKEMAWTDGAMAGLLSAV